MRFVKAIVSTFVEGAQNIVTTVLDTVVKIVNIVAVKDIVSTFAEGAQDIVTTVLDTVVRIVNIVADAAKAGVSK